MFIKDYTQIINSVYSENVFKFKVIALILVIAEVRSILIFQLLYTYKI